MPRHIGSLDGLRAIAVLLVLWVHVPPGMPGYPEWLLTARFWAIPGEFGVELFFALSGFLITRILLAEREVQLPVRWFLLRRMLRIFPIYYLLLLIMLPFEPAAEIGWCALYLGNVADVFFHTPGVRPLAHTWSLCVEEHFYLLWPLVVAFARPRTSLRILQFVAIPGAVLGAIAVCLTTDIAFANRAVAHLSPFRFLTLAAGALVAFGEPALMANPKRLARFGIALVVAAIALHPNIVFIVLPFQWLGVSYWPIELGAAGVRVHMTLLCTGILMWCLVPPERAWSPRRLLALAPLRAIGRVSYGLYLYHYPIYISVLAGNATPAKVALVIALTFAAATASYWLVERPILRYASRFRQRPRSTAQPRPAEELST